MTGDRLAIVAEPAPYCVPPVDLFRWQLVLLPKGQTEPKAEVADVFVAAVDTPSATAPAGYGLAAPKQNETLLPPTRISWANKPIDLFVANPDTLKTTQ